MKLTGTLQEAILAVICYDEEGSKILRSILKPSMFDPFYKDIAIEIDSFIEKYKKCPQDHLIDIFEIIKERRPTAADIFDQIFESIVQTKDGLNKTYIIDQAMIFIRKQRIKRTITDVLEKLKKDTPQNILDCENMLVNCGKNTGDVFDVGTCVSDPVKSLEYLKEEDLAFPTGIDLLDRYNLGPARKTLSILIALPNFGKSWWLIHTGKMGMMSGAGVLHITLEMSEKKTVQRYHQSLFSIGKRREESELTYFKKDALGRILDFKQRILKKRPSFQDTRINSKLLWRLAKLKHRPRIIVKEFPTGGITIKDIRVYIEALQAKANFYPDLLLIDYVDLMRIATKDYRIGLGQVVKDLRGLAIEYNLAVATVTQASKEAEGALWVQRKHVSEDFSKIATCDNIFTYSQTKSEEELGLARILVEKARDDKKVAPVLISQHYRLGQFCLDSAAMVSSYWDLLKEMKEEND